MARSSTPRFPVAGASVAVATLASAGLFGYAVVHHATDTTTASTSSSSDTGTTGGSTGTGSGSGLVSGTGQAAVAGSNAS